MMESTNTPVSFAPPSAELDQRLDEAFVELARAKVELSIPDNPRVGHIVLVRQPDNRVFCVLWTGTGWCIYGDTVNPRMQLTGEELVVLLTSSCNSVLHPA
jgi:hypothetical protein